VKLKPIVILFSGLSLACSVSYAAQNSTSTTTAPHEYSKGAGVAGSFDTTTTKPMPTVAAPVNVSKAKSTNAAVSSATATPATNTSVDPLTQSTNTAVVEQTQNDPTEVKQEVVSLKEQMKENNNIADVPEGRWNWYQHIRLSGLVNVDASYWSKPYFGAATRDKTSSSFLTLSQANLNIDGDFGQWITTHIGLLYSNGSSPSVIQFSPSNNVNRRLNVWDAYGTISDFDRTPFYFRAGLQFVPFGRYQMFPITQSFTQILEATDLPSIQAGFLSKRGFFGSIFVMSGERKSGESNSDQLNNYGASFGYQNYNHPVGYDFGVSFLSNMSNVDSIIPIAKKNNGYAKSVNAVSAFGDIFAGPFSLALRYVTALTRFGAADYQYTRDFTIDSGAKPSAMGITAGYRFKSFRHNSQIDLGYQRTNKAHNTATIIKTTDVTIMPKTRWIVGYGVNLIKHLALELEFYQEHDYPKSNGGTNKKNNVVTARISFLF
jgi:hypothetical protein